VGAFELATILAVAAAALAGVGIALFVGALVLVVLFRRRSAGATSPVVGREAPVLRPPRHSLPPKGPPVPPIAVSQTRTPSYFDDDTSEPETPTVHIATAARMRTASDGDHDEHTELFSKNEVEAELSAGGVMEDFTAPGARVPRSVPKR
jgi:hypothetical protein